jgi:hypothetical protein
MDPDLVVGVIGPRMRWRFQVGDPTAIAWVIVAAYAIAAVVAVLAYRAARDERSALVAASSISSAPGGSGLADPVRTARKIVDLRTLMWLWLVSAGAMVLLGANKQLDLQTSFIDTVREQAFAGGWYDRRREYQALFILVVCFVGFCSMAALAFVLRRIMRRALLVVLGLCTLVMFVIVRAASFHYVDAVLNVGGPQIRVSSVTELIGISMVIAAAVANVVTSSRSLSPIEPQPHAVGVST